MFILKYIIFLCLIFNPVLNASSLIINHIRPYGDEDNRNAYFIAMLELALKKTEDRYGSYDLKQTDIVMNQSVCSS